MTNKTLITALTVLTTAMVLAVSAVTVATAMEMDIADNATIQKFLQDLNSNDRLPIEGDPWKCLERGINIVVAYKDKANATDQGWRPDGKTADEIKTFIASCPAELAAIEARGLNLSPLQLDMEDGRRPEILPDAFYVFGTLKDGSRRMESYRFDWDWMTSKLNINWQRIDWVAEVQAGKITHIQALRDGAVNVREAIYLKSALQINTLRGELIAAQSAYRDKTEK